MNFAYPAERLDVGEVPEWLNGLVSKTGVPSGTVGSNPTLSVRSADPLCNTRDQPCARPLISLRFLIALHLRLPCRRQMPRISFNARPAA